MFTKSAAFYDAVYAAKDYAGEAERVDALIKAHVGHQAWGDERHREVLQSVAQECLDSSSDGVGLD